MQYTTIHLLIAIVGTGLCLLGFTVKRSGSFDLLRPRFIVPTIIWMATFSHVLVGYFNPPPVNRDLDLHVYLAAHGTESLMYTCLAVCCFWLGFVMPIGHKIGLRLGSWGEAFKVSDPTLRAIGFSFAGLIFLLTVVVSGPSVLNQHWGSGFELGALILRSGQLGKLIFLFSLIGAACLGMALPDWRLSPGVVLLTLISLVIYSVPLMSSFSRGSGLPLMIAALGYCVRLRRIAWLPMVSAFLLTCLLSHAGLSGRGVYGHYAGLLPYFNHLATYSLFRPGEVLLIPFDAADSLKSINVTLAAIESGTDVLLLTPLEWLVFQIPVPRMLGFHPEWSPDLTIFLGGYGTWGFTFTILGDTFGHLGWAGSLTFIYIGVLYRAVSAASFDSRSFWTGTFNPYFIWLATSYFAMFMGMFNSFRAWNVTFFYPLYLLLFVMVCLRLFRQPNS